MNLRQSSSFAITLMALIAMGATKIQAQNCTPCDIPMSEAAGAKVFGNFNCSDWYDDASWGPADTEMCKLNRIAGVAFCGCEVPRVVSESCSLCPNGSTDVDLDRELPDAPGVTCRDILQVPKIDGDESCSLLQSKYAFWCDCPRAQPSCTLCPTGVFPPKPNKALPFDTNLYCGDIATEFLISTPNQCADLEAEIPLDLASYCECPGSESPETCSLCPDGYAINDYVVVENDLTCSDIHQMARFSLDTNVCAILEDVHDQCCTDLRFASEGDSSRAVRTFPRDSLMVVGSVVVTGLLSLCISLV